jgi:hypothetical protein
MKKLIIIGLSSWLCIGTLNSCKKIYNDYYEVVPSKVMVYKANASQWSGEGNRKYIDFNVPELTQYYVNQGIVTLAMSMDNEKTYNALPAVIDGVSYSFDYMAKSVRLYAEDPIMEDHINVYVPDNIYVKIGLTEADFVE